MVTIKLPNKEKRDRQYFFRNGRRFVNILGCLHRKTSETV